MHLHLIFNPPGRAAAHSMGLETRAGAAKRLLETGKELLLLYISKPDQACQAMEILPALLTA